MKLRKFNLLVCVALILSANIYAKENFERKIHESFKLNKNSKFEIKNKFGDINIENWDKEEISIDVIIEIGAKDQEKADKIMDKIDIHIYEKDNIISAITDIEISLDNIDFSIDYFIKMPEDLEIDLSNKFGSVIINKLTGIAKITVEYGSLQATSLDNVEFGKGFVNIAYGSGNIKYCNKLDLSVKYSALEIEKSDLMSLQIRFSSANIGFVKTLKADSKYDNIVINTVETLNLTSKFSNVEIESLNKTLDLGFEYGNFEIANVKDGFDFIKVNNKYGDIEINIDSGISYKINAIVDYCGLDVPESPNVEMVKDKSHKEIKGLVGDNKSTKSEITIISKYGSIDLD